MKIELKDSDDRTWTYNEQIYPGLNDIIKLPVFTSGTGGSYRMVDYRVTNRIINYEAGLVTIYVEL